MRFKDFKNNLLESASSELESQKVMHDLDVIGQSLENLPPNKANVVSYIDNKLKSISASIEAFLSKVSPTAPQSVAAQPAPAPTLATAQQSAVPAVPTPQPQAFAQTESVVLENADGTIFDTINALKEQVKKVESLDIDDVIKLQVIKPIKKQLDLLTKQAQELDSARLVAQDKQKQAENFVKEVSVYLIALGNKVQGYQEENTEGLSSKEKTSIKKKAINAAEFTKTLKQALFGKIIDMQEEADVTPLEIKEFLAACVKGDVIDMLSVVSSDRGNIKAHVNPKFQKVFDIFVGQNIFSYSPGKTSGAIGPGEMALSMMGNPAEKAKKGDLKIGDLELEIKASASSGGRLNSKSIAKATAGWKPWKDGISKILANAPKSAFIYTTDKTGNRVKVPLSKFTGDQYNITAGKAKLGNKYNWNAKGFLALNEEVLEPYSDFDKTFDLFNSTIRSLVLNIDKIKNADRLIATAINQDGTVDWNKMNKTYAKIAYESYHLADGITSIMFLRTDTLDYSIIKDGSDLVKKLGKTVTIGSGFNWNDDQQTPTPGYMALKS